MEVGKNKLYKEIYDIWMLHFHAFCLLQLGYWTEFCPFTHLPYVRFALRKSLFVLCWLCFLNCFVFMVCGSVNFLLVRPRSVSFCAQVAVVVVIGLLCAEPQLPLQWVMTIVEFYPASFQEALPQVHPPKHFCVKPTDCLHLWPTTAATPTSTLVFCSSLFFVSFSGFYLDRACFQIFGAI